MDYRLTELGGTLTPVMSVLDQWVVDHYQEIARARDRYLRRTRQHLLTAEDSSNCRQVEIWRW